MSFLRLEIDLWTLFRFLVKCWAYALRAGKAVSQGSEVGQFRTCRCQSTEVHLAHFISLVLYAGSLITWLRSLTKGGRGPGPSVAFSLASLGVLVHGFALFRFTSSYNQLPLTGLGPSLSSLALVIGLALVGTIVFGEGRRIGIVVIPFIILLETMAIILGIEPSAEVLDFQGAWFALHVMLAFVGVGGMTLSFASSSLYVIQLGELNNKRMGRLFQFTPSLATLDRISRVSLVFGFVTFTLALGLGWFWTITFRQSLDQFNPKVLWSVMTWFVFVGVFLARRFCRLKPQRGAWASIWGFAVVVLSYVALRLFVSTKGFFL